MFPRSTLGFTDIKIADVFIILKASLKYEFQSLNDSRQQNHHLIMDSDQSTYGLKCISLAPNPHPKLFCCLYTNNV